jgi:hypothetical protein
MPEPDSLRSVTVDADRFTEILADRLAAIVPSGFHVRAGDGMLWYSAEEGRFPGQQGDHRVGRSGTYIRENLGGFDSDEDGLVAVAEQALDELEDYVDEATHDPWPGTRRQPIPRAQIRHAALHLWYADGGNVVLACEPIPLADIVSPV